MSVDSFSSQQNTQRPYYIFTPDYTRLSAGIRAMHLLCHQLNRRGEEAYIVADLTDPRLRTPFLTPEIKLRHKEAGTRPIAVYPEIVFNNPLGARSVARFILNHPGLISGPKVFPDSELLFFYNQEYANSVPDRPPHLLQIPTIDTSIFNNTNPTDTSRSGILIYPGRDIEASKRYPDLFRNGTVITYNWPSTHQELASLLRTSECLYCFSNSAIAQESVLCGCPVVFMESPLTIGFLDVYRRNPIMGRPPGMAIDPTEADLERARQSIPEFTSIYRASEARFSDELTTFIDLTQAMPESNTIQNEMSEKTNEIAEIKTPCQIIQPPFNLIYQDWLGLRQQLKQSDRGSIEKLADRWQFKPSFQIITKVNAEPLDKLADTLDGLNNQLYSNWHLNIVSTQKAPIEADEIPCVSWHEIKHSDDTKGLVDSLVTSGCAEWILELPPGAILNDLCLWRIAHEINQASTITTFFVDDDSVDQRGFYKGARFKAGVNIEWLQSTDLAGPLFVRRDAWLATGGASKQNGSPWFRKLLKLADKFSWSSIKHVPDVLISYRDTFPNAPDTCLHALFENFQQKGITSEIIPVTGQSWRIRYPLPKSPKISIAVLSAGHLDLLRRCINSITTKTIYSDFEIILVLTDSQNDHDVRSSVELLQAQTTVPFRCIYTDAKSNHAARSNLAVRATDNEFVLLLREEVVAVQANWLEELIRTCLQPGIAAVSPRLISPGSGYIEYAGGVLGLDGLVGSPHRQELKFNAAGYLDCLQVARDVSSLSPACILVRKSAYLAANGMDEEDLGDYLADADLCQRILAQNGRLIFQPLANLVYDGNTKLNINGDIARNTEIAVAEAHASSTFISRWFKKGAADPFWNPNLSLESSKALPETDYFPQWQCLPSETPRILARPLVNGQGVFRVESPMRALRKAGMISQCIWPRATLREPSVSEISRLAPDSVIVQHYILDNQLAALHAWHSMPSRPFLIYTLDDLFTNMEESNPLRIHTPANCWVRLKYALERCDRMVVSTKFLAEAYRHVITDIRVVPNRLERHTWLPLHTLKRTGPRPRIGWAGGTTHRDDLLLLKETIEQTRNEADWILFGMCPEEIRPLLTEYHEFGAFTEYPARLAALNLDLAVAPLANTPFNQGKSNLRLLEYGVLGIPVVCSDIDPYRESPACSVTNTTSAWVEALRARIHDTKAREREGATLRDWVCRHYLLEDHMDDWMRAHLPD